MNKIIAILLMISAVFAQEVKIDSVMIMDRIDMLETGIIETANAANEQIGQMRFAIRVLEDMLIPKEIEVENE